MAFTKGNKNGKGGKRKGSGRKPIDVRLLCAQCFTDRVPILCEIADGDKIAPKDRISALKELARVGIAERVEHSGTDGGSIKVESRQAFDYDGFQRAVVAARQGN